MVLYQRSRVRANVRGALKSLVSIILPPLSMVCKASGLYGRVPRTLSPTSSCVFRSVFRTYSAGRRPIRLANWRSFAIGSTL